MVNVKHGIFALLIAAGAILVFFLFFQGDEAKIKKRFHALAELAEKNGNEHNLIAAKKAHQIEQMFSKTVRIQIPSYDIDRSFDNRDISSHVLYARARYQTISLEFHDFRFDFPEDETAVVSLTGVLNALTGSGERIREFHEMVSTLEKTDCEWLITGVSGVDVLEK